MNPSGIITRGEEGEEVRNMEGPNINGLIAIFYGPGKGDEHVPFEPVYFILPPTWPPNQEP